MHDFRQSPAVPLKLKKRPLRLRAVCSRSEMAIKKHRLHPGEQGIAAIQMAPARLNHADFRIGKEMDRLAQQVGRRNKIGIENTDEFARGRKPAPSPAPRL